MGLALTQAAGWAGVSWPVPAMAAQTADAHAEQWFDGSKPRAETRAFLALLRRADEHGLDPADYQVDAITRALADTAQQRKAGQMLSAALTAYARDLRVGRSASKVIYIDPELRPSVPTADDFPIDGTLASRLEELHPTNPVYEELRGALGLYRATWSHLPQTAIPEGPPLALGSRGARVALLRKRLGVPAGANPAQFDAALGAAVGKFREAHGLAPLPVADRDTIAALNLGAAHYEGIIKANLDRLRGLPLAGRYVMVDTTAARLRLIEDGREVDSMRVVVGKPGMETPLLAAYIRYALVNPYWNVPPDLVRKNIAPAVMREGEAALKRKNYVLSTDWKSYTRVDPRKVDWPAIAEGRKSIWVRQLPGGANMMGAVKFMLPNEMGIYLHDTPDKSLFQRDNRHLSSGCVRLEDAPRLAQWLFGRPILGGDPAPDRRVGLPRPVPVFITYLTAVAENGQVRFRPDLEHRDKQGQSGDGLAN